MRQTKPAPARPRRLLHTICLSSLTLGLGPGLVTPAVGNTGHHLQIAGYVERVRLMDTDLVLKARMDTGATTSSLHAVNLKRFKKKGKEWVRFQLDDPDQEDGHLTLEYPVLRNVRIIRHDGDHQRRPIIKLSLCIGTHLRLEEVSLVNRSEFTYPLLVGRNHMSGAILVDPGKRYLLPPDCSNAS
ncbi:MAG: RimK/LysX family protein [Castellaniella sp.]